MSRLSLFLPLVKKEQRVVGYWKPISLTVCPVLLNSLSRHNIIRPRLRLSLVVTKAIAQHTPYHGCIIVAFVHTFGPFASENFWNRHRYSTLVSTVLHIHTGSQHAHLHLYLRLHQQSNIYFRESFCTRHSRYNSTQTHIPITPHKPPKRLP